MIYAELRPSDVHIDCFSPRKRQIPSCPHITMQSAGQRRFSDIGEAWKQAFRQIVLCFYGMMGLIFHAQETPMPALL
ncbi:hypothetical protein PSYPI_18091 [Pseudomonas syringae pv. pisi str. 1704B]|uniref:Uncharacterized protein n=5 Tax=Pseudomonas TaxID=286 RepID=F3GAU5_PSESJ|nr:hypothetical protein PSYPI_18091 [Pseudomonas syringae pv. pisi str. 1704B]